MERGLLRIQFDRPKQMLLCLLELLQAEIDPAEIQMGKGVVRVMAKSSLGRRDAGLILPLNHQGRCQQVVEFSVGRIDRQRTLGGVGCLHRLARCQRPTRLHQQLRKFGGSDRIVLGQALIWRRSRHRFG